MKYTVKDLRSDFPDDAACLEWLVNWLYPNGITCKVCNKVTKHHPMKTRKSYSCQECGHHLHPTAGTIFHKSRTPLTDWFYAIWMMSSNKAGTSAKQIERELGVTYKTAWRMMHQIRKMMEAPEELLGGEVEIDETYIHPNVYKRSTARTRYGPTGRRSGQYVFGMVERGPRGRAHLWHVKKVGAALIPIIEEYVDKNAIIYSDSYRAYNVLYWKGYKHHKIEHYKQIYVQGNVHTQNIENVWGGFKRGIKGVYRHIGHPYIQTYANEYAWRYSHRNDVNMFWSLLCSVHNKAL